MFTRFSVFVILKFFTNFQTIVCITENVYFNSYENCGKVIHEVSLKKDFRVLPDVTSDTKTRSFRDCEMTFHSNKDLGRICLMQTGNKGIIKDPNAQLEAWDGLGDSDDHVIANIKRPEVWTAREYCSDSPYITLYLKEIQKHAGADIRNVHIEFRVVVIESPERVLYLDGNYCNKQYKLLNSQVTLWNRPQFPGMTLSTLPNQCGIAFQKVKAEETKNTTICVAYLPSENVDCESQWRFAVSVAYFSLDEKHIKYNLKCNDSKATKIHVWCADLDVSSVTVILWRRDNIMSNSSVEASKMFRYIVRDYSGTEGEFLSEIKARFAPDSSGGLFRGWLLYTVIALGVFVIALVVCVVCWRKRKPPYKEVEMECPTSRAV